MRLKFVSLFALCFLVALAGCTKDTSPAKVTGKVTFNGQPLVKAMVLFNPMDGSRSSTGVTDANGEYTLRFSPSNEGAVIGEHRVQIVTAGGESPAGTPDIEKLPTKYNKETELKAVLKNGKQEVNFDLMP